MNLFKIKIKKKKIKKIFRFYRKSNMELAQLIVDDYNK